MYQNATIFISKGGVNGNTLKKIIKEFDKVALYHHYCLIFTFTK
jgi:hypothetical protein